MIVWIKGRENFMMNLLEKIWRDEDAVGVVELILILVVIIGLVVIFKNQMTSLVNKIFSSVTNGTKKITG